MNTWGQVSEKLNGWLQEGKKDPEAVVLLANACIGWPYVYGGRGEPCTPTNRKQFYESKKVANIRDKCQVLVHGGTCNGCRWHPGGVVLFYDCRGFTYWVLLKAAGIRIAGGGATTQWNTDGNWAEKGTIDRMPKDKVCCVFRYDKNTGKMEHTLLYDGNGNYIHCSASVQKTPISKYAATHYAIPKGLYKADGGSSGGSSGGDKKPETDVAPGKGEYVVTGTKVALRQGPSTSASVITRVDTGKIVKDENAPEDWAYVSYNGKAGYMMKKFLRKG